MGRDLFEASASARDLLERASATTGRDLATLVLEGPEAALHENLAAQASVYVVSIAAARELERRGVTPAATAGYSLGNYAAMVAAGAVSFDDALAVLTAVWVETESLDVRGAMGAIVGARRETVDEVCAALQAVGSRVWIGNVNAPTQFVLTGDAEAVAVALQALAPKALRVLPLPMNWPIHSERMLPVARAVAPVVDACGSIRAPTIPYFGPDGARVETAERVREILATEFCHSTLWNAAIEGMVASGLRNFLEVGPGDMLTKLMRWIDRSVACRPAGTLAAIADIVAA